MWIVKGVLLGILLFVVGGITYVGILVGIGLYKLREAAIERAAQIKAGLTTFSGGGVQWDVRGLLRIPHNPVFWGALFAAIAIGLWIVRARSHAA